MSQSLVSSLLLYSVMSSFILYGPLESHRPWSRGRFRGGAKGDWQVNATIFPWFLSYNFMKVNYKCCVFGRTWLRPLASLPVKKTVVRGAPPVHRHVSPPRFTVSLSPSLSLPLSPSLSLSRSWVPGRRRGAAAGQRSHGGAERRPLIGGGHPENQRPHHRGEGPAQRRRLRPHDVRHALVPPPQYDPESHIIKQRCYTRVLDGTKSSPSTEINGEQIVSLHDKYKYIDKNIWRRSNDAPPVACSALKPLRCLLAVSSQVNDTRTSWFSLALSPLKPERRSLPLSRSV